MPFATDLGCPACAAEGVESRITDTGSGYSCGKGHKFVDTSELMASGPKKMPLPPKAPVRVLPGYVKMEIFIPEKLKKAMESKFGGRIDATLVSICTTLMDPGACVMSSEDISQLSRYFAGKNIRHGGELLGEVFTIFTERNSLKEQIEKKDSSSFSGAVLARPNPETFKKLKQVAESKSVSVSQLATEVLETATKNDWF